MRFRLSVCTWRGVPRGGAYSTHDGPSIRIDGVKSENIVESSHRDAQMLVELLGPASLSRATVGKTRHALLPGYFVLISLH